MKKSFRRIFAMLMVSAFLAAGLPAAPALAAAGPKEIPVQFPTLDHAYEWTFPYDDEYFTRPPEEFSRELAQASIGLAVSAFRPGESKLPLQYESYLRAAGFEKIRPFGYDREIGTDTLSGVLASKKIGDFTLIAAVPCGSGYEREWSGNMQVGDEERHVGFNRGAAVLESQIDLYLAENAFTGPLKLWLTGFSRAAAVANLTAADMDASGRFESIYAYLFGVPRTTRKPLVLPGVYNICGKNDPVTQVPMECWGYGRYGLDLFTPSEETDSRYFQLLSKASEVMREINGERMWSNPEVNHQLHMIIEFLGELFPTPADYVEDFQAALMSVWQDENDDLFAVLSQAIRQVEKLDAREAYSSDIFLEYLSFVSSQHLQEDQKQVEEGRWNPQASLSENIMREHLPTVYIAWLFSDNGDEPLLQNTGFTRCVVVETAADVEVYYQDRLVSGARRDGSTYFGEADAPEDALDVCIIRNNEVALVYLPMNDRFSLRLRPDKRGMITFFEVARSPFFTYGVTEELRTFMASPGEYALDADYAEPLSPVRVVQGSNVTETAAEFEYSPTMIMAVEASSTEHLSLGDLLKLLLGVATFVPAVLLVCLAGFLVRLRGRKRGKTYSPWWGIVPHLVLAAQFAWLTQLFTVRMFTIGLSRQLFAGLTLLCLLLLALRGTWRHRNRWNLAVTAGLALLLPADLFLYQAGSLASSSPGHFVGWGLVLLLAAMLATGTHFVKTGARQEVLSLGRKVLAGLALGALLGAGFLLWAAPEERFMAVLCLVLAAGCGIGWRLLRREKKPGDTPRAEAI